MAATVAKDEKFTSDYFFNTTKGENFTYYDETWFIHWEYGNRRKGKCDLWDNEKREVQKGNKKRKLRLVTWWNYDMRICGLWKKQFEVEDEDW